MLIPPESGEAGGESAAVVVSRTAASGEAGGVSAAAVVDHAAQSGEASGASAAVMDAGGERQGKR